MKHKKAIVLISVAVLLLAAGAAVFFTGSSNKGTDESLIYQKEAERAKVSNGARRGLSLKASGRIVIKNIGTNDSKRKDGTVVFDDIDIAEAGFYRLNIYFQNDKSIRHFYLTTNGSRMDKIDCRASGKEWSGICLKTADIWLEQGKNILEFSCEDWYAPYLDYIEILEIPENEKDKIQLSDTGSQKDISSAPETCKYDIAFDMANGTYDVLSAGREVVRDAFASYVFEEQKINSTQYAGHKLENSDISTDFGSGIRYTFTHTDEKYPTLRQYFDLYPDLDYFITYCALLSNNAREIKTDWISPLCADSESCVDEAFTGDDCMFLEVPFDNDGFVSFNIAPVNSSGQSHEVGAIYNENTKEGLVFGSLTHDTWKSAVRFFGSGEQIKKLCLYSGASTEYTWDQSPHGEVSGQSVQSAQFFIGKFEDWTLGMDTYAYANTLIAPTLPSFDENVPIGWNSWGSIQSSLTSEDAYQISDYIKENFQDVWQENGNTVYINLDSYWDFAFSREDLKDFVDHCKANGQKAGIYYAPFATWWSEEELYTNELSTSPGVKYADVVLRRTDGEMYETLDGAFPLDPTHPAVIKEFDAILQVFLDAGFEYIKMDFLTHGTLEGIHYNENIQTGIQAYNYAMNHISEFIDGRMFINLSIAPIFPYQYANGRRLACDTFYSIDDTKYLLNALTYGFWEKNLYAYPDPDHIVVWGKDGKAGLNEARSRVTSGAISGTSFLTGDNFVSPAGNQDKATERYESLLTNKEIIALAASGKIFKPLSLPYALHRPAANTFYLSDGDCIYIAAFNFSKTQATPREIPLESFNLDGDVYSVHELWSGESIEINENRLSFNLDASDAKVFKISLGEK